MRHTLLSVSVLIALSGLAVAGLLHGGRTPSQTEVATKAATFDHRAATRASRATAAPFIGGDRQINDPQLDTIETFPGTRPFVNTSNADASLAAYGPNVVTVFSTSGAKMTPGTNGVFAYERNLQIGYAYSRNGGHTWHSAYLPPLPGSTWTGGAGTAPIGYGIVDVDRRGRFYVAALGQSADNRFTLGVNTSRDGGQTFSPAAAIEAEGRIEKPWIAVGTDPVVRTRDNVYLSWTRNSTTAFTSVLRFARSTDGGNTFTAKTIFAPPPDPELNNPQDLLDYSTPVVDKFTGKIYIALLNFGFVNSDYLRILVSEDGGQTFSSLKFNRPGAPNPEVMPVVQPGTSTECGTFTDAQGQLRLYTPLTLHAGDSVPGGASALPRYAQATRLFLQPALAVSKGVIHLTWSNSTTPFYGDPTSGANILYMRSEDDGRTWSEPVVVNEHDVGTQRSVMPAIAIGRFQGETALPFLPSPKDVHITYYTQRPDGSVVMNLAQSKDRGASFPASLKRQLSSQAFELPPTNVPLPAPGNAFQTTHYNRNRIQCAALGDYTGLAVGFGRLHAAWGDTRNTITQPVDALDPMSGQTHPKEDVFYAAPPIR